MNRPSSISIQYISAIVITLLLLIQTNLVLHEIEHVDSGDSEHCVSCWLADHQKSSTSENFTFKLAQFSDYFIALAATNLLLTHLFDYYTSRAPPASHFS